MFVSMPFVFLTSCMYFLKKMTTQWEKINQLGLFVRELYMYFCNGIRSSHLI